MFDMTRTMSCVITFLPFPCHFLFGILVLVAALTAFQYLKMKKNKSVVRLMRQPPSPPKIPIIGNLHKIGKLPHQDLWKLSQKYGPAMLLQLGNVPTLVISSAEMAKQILKTQDVIFCSRAPSPGQMRIFYNSLDVATCPYGERWRETRKIFVSHLLSSKRAQSFAKARETEVCALVNYLSAHSPSPVKLDAMIFDLLGGIIGSVAFGKSLKGMKFKGQGMRDVLDEAMLMMNSFSVEDFFPVFGRIVDFLSGHKARLNRCFHVLDGILEMLLNEHLTSPKSNVEEDLIDALIGLSGDESAVLNFSKEHIKAMLMNTFLGGVDTSAIAIVWAMAELMNNPRVMKKAQEEIRGILGVKSKVESDDLDKFTYLKMIVKETFRLHPPVPLLLPRECMRTCQINGENGDVYDIFEKTRVLINAWAIGRDLNSWKNPGEFYPERFEGSDIDFKGQNYELVPFGGGRRVCPAVSASSAVIELTLASLLYWFNWKVADGMTVQGGGINMEEEGGVTVHKKLQLTLIPIKYIFDNEKL